MSLYRCDGGVGKHANSYRASVLSSIAYLYSYDSGRETSPDNPADSACNPIDGKHMPEKLVDMESLSNE